MFGLLFFNGMGKMLSLYIPAIVFTRIECDEFVCVLFSERGNAIVTVQVKSFIT